MPAREMAANRRMPNAANLFEELFMASLEAHYAARNIETRILAALRAAGLNPARRSLEEGQVRLVRGVFRVT